MMSINEEDIDLGLALGSTNYNVETRLNSSSGAGVNANSRVDMAFTASDPLSELVWSPHNGLSLKCADSSLANNKPFLRWNVGPSIKELSTSQSIRSKGSGDDKVVDEEKLTISQTMLDGDGKFADNATLFRPSRGSSSCELVARHRYCDAGSNGKMEEEAGNTDAIQKEENLRDNVQEDFCSKQNVQIADIAESSKKNAEQDILADGTHDSKVDMAINWQFSNKLIRRARCNLNSRVEINASRSDVMGLAVPIHSEPHTEALVCSLPNLQSRQEPDDEVTSASGEVKKNKTRMPIPLPGTAMMKLESTDENDLGHLAAKEAHSSGEMRLPSENSLPVDKSPTNSRACLYQENGKERALSEDDDSHESVESCNSVGLFSKGIKRQSYDQVQLVGSKRRKKQIQGSHGSTSIVRPDSSFMNWISNMVKGLSESNKKESSSLTLTLARSNNVCGNNQQENFMCNKSHDNESPNVGFQSIFQSLYCRNTKLSDSGLQKDNYSMEESKELMVADEISFKNLPRSCDRNNDNSCEQIILSNKEVNPHISRNIVGHPSKPWIFSAEFARTPYVCERSLAKNKASDIPVCNRAKGEVSPSDSSCKQVNSTAENASLNIPLAMSCMPEKSNPLASLWITRLYTRTARSENCNQITEEARECSTECPKANLDNLITDVFSIDQKISAEDQVRASEQKQEMQRFAAKASVDFKSTHKLSPIQLSQKSRSSEAMTSVFSKRLDALRHIIHPSEKTKSSTCTLICFFCGRSGHDLRKCPELTETELEDLLVKINSFDRVEESPCLCIRCFQFDHWAISCPLVSSRRHRRSEQNADVISHYTTCHLQLFTGNDKCSSNLGGEEDDHKQVAAARVACSSRKPCLGSFPSYLTWDVKGSSSKRLSTSNEFQKSTASSSENDLKDKQIFPPCNLLNAENAVVQEEMFHAIRKLRLSRADILRWMNSNVSLLHLNGFFLRLRLGKLEAGLGGTGYYVARITGDTEENIGCNSKKSILVDVGGVKSSVGSQYVSNHDFLEDEIKVWWSRTLKSGGKIPSLDELNSKFKDRTCLGF
ncbi:hypothetical protein Pfo_026358 [Paulownia fortunei]|nr:hypothetical protein Pfo_026358 [Paulownia fortunei]